MLNVVISSSFPVEAIERAGGTCNVSINGICTSQNLSKVFGLNWISLIMYLSTELNQFPSTQLVCILLCRPCFFRSAALENYFRWSRRSCSTRFPSIHHLAVSLHREVGHLNAKPTNQPVRFPSISPSPPCCASIWLLESPTKPKYLECKSWNALQKATGAPYCSGAPVSFCMWISIVIPHLIRASVMRGWVVKIQLSPARGKTTKIWRRTSALIEVRVCYCGTLGAREEKVNTQMWKWYVCSRGWSNTCLWSREWTNRKKWSWVIAELMDLGLCNFLYQHDILSLAECN